jgi:hypothetical protein
LAASLPLAVGIADRHGRRTITVCYKTFIGRSAGDLIIFEKFNGPKFLPTTH